MHQPIAPIPLCTNCVHRGRCTFERRAAGPVLFCELHTMPPAPVRLPVRPGPAPAMAVGGLCSTCDNRDHCALRKQDRIILHCEHYR